MAIELWISSQDMKREFSPLVEEGIEWQTERRGVPGKLTFKILSQKGLDISEGSAVRLIDGNDKLFFGYVFKRNRSKDGLVSITAWDQIRYLKNKDTIKYVNKKASEFIRMLGADFQLNLGEIQDTGYVIPRRNEDNLCLLDMISNALDLTLQNTKKMFILYDDFGYLTLKSLDRMKVGEQGAYLMVDEESGEDFEYGTSIDDKTYNQVKLAYENNTTGKRDIYLVKSGENINRWGILQYFDTLKEHENGQAKADALLSLYNQKTRKLVLKNVFGDNRVRAGSLIVVILHLDDIRVQNFMLVEKCRHIWKNEEHFMDLTLRGGEFNG